MNNTTTNISNELIQAIYNDLDTILNKEVKIKNEEKKCLCDKNYEEQKTNDNIIQTNEYLICYNCGFVFEIENIDMKAEWNVYSDENNQTNTDNIRCAVPFSDCYGKSHLRTYMKYNTFSNTYSNYKNLMKLNLYSHQNSTVKKQKDIMLLLNSFNENLHLDTFILNEITSQYIKLESIYRGQKRIGVLAALVYNYLKNTNSIKSLHEISNCFNIDTHIVTQCMSILSNNNLLISNKNEEYVFLKSFCDSFNISEKHYIFLQKMHDAIILLNLFSSSPQSLSISLIYYLKNKTNNYNFTLTELIELSDIKDSSIKKFYNIILKNEQLILNYIKSKN